MGFDGPTEMFNPVMALGSSIHTSFKMFDFMMEARNRVQTHAFHDQNLM